MSFVVPQARAMKRKIRLPALRASALWKVPFPCSPAAKATGAVPQNRPMTIGDKIWVDKDSRAELQAGTVSIHLGSMTALSFLNLDQGITQMRWRRQRKFSRQRIARRYLIRSRRSEHRIHCEAGRTFRIDVNDNGDSAA